MFENKTLILRNGVCRTIHMRPAIEKILDVLTFSDTYINVHVHETLVYNMINVIVTLHNEIQHTINEDMKLRESPHECDKAFISSQLHKGHVVYNLDSWINRFKFNKLNYVLRIGSSYTATKLYYIYSHTSTLEYKW